MPAESFWALLVALAIIALIIAVTLWWRQRKVRRGRR